MFIEVSDRTVTSRLATALQYYKDDHSLDDHELAEQLGVTVLQLINWREGISSIKKEKLIQITQELRINMVFIATGVGNPVAA